MNKSILLIFFYKTICLLLGTFICWLGYLCFANNYIQKAGNLNAQYSTSNLNLTQAAPGTFFCVLGAFVMIFTIVKGLKFEESHSQKPSINELTDRIINHPITGKITGATNKVITQSDGNIRVSEISEVTKISAEKKGNIS
jgi:hypothetical protein